LWIIGKEGTLPKKPREGSKSWAHLHKERIPERTKPVRFVVSSLDLFKKKGWGRKVKGRNWGKKAPEKQGKGNSFVGGGREWWVGKKKVVALRKFRLRIPQAPKVYLVRA